MDLSVIICTHNPVKEYLNRCLDALKTQTFDKMNWELIVVDNGSPERVDSRFDISWHPNGKFAIEEKLGLTHARLKGISEANGELLVFFDDDNVPESNFLEVADIIAIENPKVGVFGGNLIGEFEIQPPDHYRNYLNGLALRQVDRDIWSNLFKWDTVPAGAGLVIRSHIARKYAANILTDDSRLSLDRKGKSLMSGGDGDMALTAVDMGYGCGLFKDLNLIHIIPKNRISEKYFLNLLKHLTLSLMLLEYYRFNRLPKKHSFLHTLKNIARVMLYEFNSNLINAIIFEIKRGFKMTSAYNLFISLIKK